MITRTWDKSKARVEVVTDPAVILSVVRDPVLYDAISDDGSPSVDEWEPDMAHTWFGCYYSNVLIGVPMMHQINAAMWQMHALFLPKYWGTGLPRLLAPMVKSLAFELSGAKKFYAIIPTANEVIVEWAQKVWGMEIEGTCKDGWLKNGKYMNIYHMGVSR